MESSKTVLDCLTLGDYNATINVMPAKGGRGGGGGVRQGIGWGFDFFQKFAIKFPAHG